MNIRKISNKASIFLNHKHFHPGNSKNRERLWLAEEKKKEEERKQEELLKKRKKELEIEELKREFKRSNKGLVDSFPGTDNGASIEQRRSENDCSIDNDRIKNALIGRKSNSFPASQGNKKSCALKSRLYEEDVFVNNHSSVWGSYFDPDTRKWGYRCCKNTSKESICDKKSKSDCPGKHKRNNDCATNSGSNEHPANSESKHSSNVINSSIIRGKPCRGVSEFLSILNSTR